MWRRLGVVGLVVASVGFSATEATATAPGRDGRIAYVDDHGTGHFQLYSIRPDGTGRRQLTHLPGGKSAYFPDWAPGGRRIAYSVTSSDGSGEQIYVARADGSSARRLTNDPAVTSNQPRWSPDGRLLAFQRARAGGKCDIETRDDRLFCHIWVMRADGTGARPLTTKSRANEFDPEWSPGGRFIAYDSDRGGLISALWVMHADGSHQHRITAPRVMAVWPSWSPSGREIAFSTLFGGPLLAVHPDGSDLRTVAPATSRYRFHDFPSWSPAGDRIAFASANAAGQFVLGTVRPNGSHARSLVSGPATQGPPFLDFGPAR